MGRKKPDPTPSLPALPLAEPTPRRRVSIAAAQAAQLKRMPAPRLVFKASAESEGTLQASVPHSDQAGGWAEVQEAFGSTSSEFASRLMAHGENMRRCRASPGLDEDRSNAHLAAMAGIAPADEHEAMLANLIIGSYELAQDNIARAQSAESLPLRDAYVTQATKVSRTVAALTDSLVKLRSGGKQQVEVRYVYVDARGSQNVIGALPPGATAANHHQPHAATAALELATGVPLWGQDPAGSALPVAGGEGSEALQDARGQEPGCTEGQGERAISDGTTDAGAGRVPPARQSACQRRSGRGR